ncbi:LysR family transcriptional regulator substrate-binding protein [Paracoccus sp. PAR01]|nr:LysR family transcriptional regulator substrate-binding protein [Paracoccus sp. PAR01]
MNEIDALRGARRGVLRIGALPIALQQLLPDALIRFNREAPDISIVVHEGINENLLPQLYNGRLTSSSPSSRPSRKAMISNGAASCSSRCGSSAVATIPWPDLNGSRWRICLPIRGSCPLCPNRTG